MGRRISGFDAGNIGTAMAIPFLLVVCLGLSCGKKEPLESGAVPRITWQNVYGGTGDDEPIVVIGTSDGGCLVAGWTNSYGYGRGDFYFLKLDKNGNVMWENAYGRENEDELLAITALNGGGYLAAGLTHPQDRPTAVYLVKLDQYGSMVGLDSLSDTTKFYEWADVNSDGTFVAAGMKMYTAYGDQMFVETGSTGSFGTSTNLYGDSFIMYYPLTVALCESSILVFGYRVDQSAGTDAPFAMRIGQLGGPLWEKIYPAFDNHNWFRVTEEPSGGLMLQGFATDVTRLLRADANGNQLWTRSVNGYASRVMFQADDQFLMAGHATSGYVWSSLSIFLSMFDDADDGNLVWQEFFDSPDTTHYFNGECMGKAKDGGFFVCSRLYNRDEGMNVWVAKTDVSGKL